MRPMQLERLLHAQGFGSRKDCRALIRAGYVSIAGEVCDDPMIACSIIGREYPVLPVSSGTKTTADRPDIRTTPLSQAILPVL